MNLKRITFGKMSFEEKYLGKGTSFWFKFEPMGKLLPYKGEGHKRQSIYPLK